MSPHNSGYDWPFYSDPTYDWGQRHRDPEWWTPEQREAVAKLREEMAETKPFDEWFAKYEELYAYFNKETAP